MIMLIGISDFTRLVGSKESKNRYRKKQYQTDKILTDLFRGEGGKPGETYGDFKRRIKRVI